MGPPHQKPFRAWRLQSAPGKVNKMKDNTITMEKPSLTAEILGILKENSGELPEGYTGAEWIEAANEIAKLEDRVSLKIPWCVWDYELDEFGVNVMESRYDHLGRDKAMDDDGVVDEGWQPKPERRSRNDVLAILAWIPIKREDPDLPLFAVTKMLNNDNIVELTRMVMKFWGVDMDAIEERMRQVIESGEQPQEAGEDANFPT